MTTPSRSRATSSVAEPRAAVPLLVRATAFSIFVIPSSMVIAPLGASGTVPLMLSWSLLAAWLASWIWGLHRPLTARHPGRLAGGVFALTMLASYLAMHLGWTGPVTPAGYAASDRWLLLVAASLGLILAVGDCVRRLDGAMELVRWVLGGAFVACVIGVIQFFFRVNPVEWMQSMMVGFAYNGGDTPFQLRGNLVRVAGTTFTSIEFAVVMAMLLPLSIWRAQHDTRGRKWFHWVQTALLIFAVAATVSRSGTIALLVALVVFLPFTSRALRRRVLLATPVVLIIMFTLVPGFVGTLLDALTTDSSDPSISTRLNNYPRVARMIDLRPAFGVGPGNYVTENALQILDNQYLGSAVSTGLVGLAGIVVYLLLPAMTSVHAARHAVDPALRSLAGALAAGLAIAGVCSATFDSLSFPVFALAYPLLVGLAGAAWQMVQNESVGPRPGNGNG